jgi:hypothetical protein
MTQNTITGTPHGQHARLERGGGGEEGEAVHSRDSSALPGLQSASPCPESPCMQNITQGVDQNACFVTVCALVQQQH